MRYLPPDTPYAEASDGPDDSLPGERKPYFLKAGEGPRHTLFGQTTFQLMTGAESGGSLGMTTTEGPKGAVPAHVHKKTHEAIYCLEGRLRATVDGDEHLLTRGDFFNVPAGVEHALALESHLTSWVTMYGPAGPERFYELAGQICKERIFPDEAPVVDNDRVVSAGSEVDTRLA
jgi:quercetin 2,3-dioxygenase